MPETTPPRGRRATAARSRPVRQDGLGLDGQTRVSAQFDA